MPKRYSFIFTSLFGRFTCVQKFVSFYTLPGILNSYSPSHRGRHILFKKCKFLSAEPACNCCNATQFQLENFRFLCEQSLLLKLQCPTINIKTILHGILGTNTTTRRIHLQLLESHQGSRGDQKAIYQH